VSDRTQTITAQAHVARKYAWRVRQRGCNAHRSSRVRMRPGPAVSLSQRAWTVVNVTPARRVGEQALSAVRKVHHPKIVQRSDGRWLVVCQDCKRDGESATPEGINSPVESFEAARLLWEGHCERGSSPMRRGA